MVQPERVCNPRGMQNSATLYEGIQLAKSGRRIGIHVATSTRSSYYGPGYGYDSTFIPWVAKDGTPNVIHKTGMMLPGMLRGVSMFAPMLVLMSQLKGITEALVAAKRAQACHSLIVKLGDSENSQKIMRSLRKDNQLGPYAQMKPLSILFTDQDVDVQQFSPKLDGDDVDAFLTTGWKLLAASWKMPIEVVLARMGEASLSSARAGLDHYNRVGHQLQNEHITCVSSVIDESIVREAVLRGWVDAGTDDWTLIMAGKYKRPAKFSTDVLKEAQSVKAEIEAGRAPSMAYSDRGWDWEAEQEQRIQDQEYVAALVDASSLSDEPEEPDDVEEEEQEDGDGEAMQDEAVKNAD